MEPTRKLEFSSKVLGPSASDKLLHKQIIKTFRSHKYAERTLGTYKRYGLDWFKEEEVDVHLDGLFIGQATISYCRYPRSINDLQAKDAWYAGFSTKEKLFAALKRAGFRFRPLADYKFVEIVFQWKNDICPVCRGEGKIPYPETKSGARTCINCDGKGHVGIFGHTVIRSHGPF